MSRASHIGWVKLFIEHISHGFLLLVRTEEIALIVNAIQRLCQTLSVQSSFVLVGHVDKGVTHVIIDVG